MILRNLIILIFISYGLAGCIQSSENTTNYGNWEAFEDEELFSLSGCKGVELTSEWVGPYGPNGPPNPPAEWDYSSQGKEFSWGMEILQCSRIGWGPLERGPLWVGIEYHDAYIFPDDCLKGLEETSYSRYLHSVYSNDINFTKYSYEKSMKAIISSFEMDDINSGRQLQLSMETEEGNNSLINIFSSSAYSGVTPDINVAFFWLEGELLHRLSLYRQTEITLGDAAVLEMSPPTILGDRPNPQVAVANLLTNLSWTGDLTTFSDASCTTQVFP